MASSSEKFKLVFEAQEAASKKIRELNRELAALGGPKLLKSQKEIAKLQRGISQLNGKAKKGSILFSRFTQGIAAGNIIANTVTAAFTNLQRAIVGSMQRAISQAGEYEASMVSLKAVAATTGRDFNVIMEKMKGQMGSLADKTQVASGFLKGMTTTLTVEQIDQMTSAIKNASIAMGEDFGTTLPLIIKAVKQLNPNILDNIGVTVRLDQVNKRIREGFYGMGTAITEATQQHAIFTEIMKQTSQFAGQEAAFLETTKGKWTALQTAVSDALTDIGTELLTAFGDDAHDGLNNITTAVRNLGANASGVAQLFVGAAGVIVNSLQVAKDAIDVILSPIADYIAASVHLLTGDFSSAWNAIKDTFTNVAEESEDVNRNFDELMESMAQLAQGVTVVSDAIKVVPSETNNAVTETVNQAKDKILEIPQALQEIDDNIEEEITMATRGLAEVVNESSIQLGQFSERASNMVGSMVGNMIDNMVSGRQSMGEIFKGMAQDFMAFFIKSALSMVISSFIPGLGGILGSIFDTPVNDRMAARQGRDFMQWFTRGALAEANGGSELAVGLTSSNNITPVAPATSGSGMVMMTVNVKGNVMSDQYTERKIAPTLQRLVYSGRSLLDVQNEQETGGRDVIID